VSERLLTAADLADLLAMSPDTIIDWAAAGRVPSFKLGQAVRFRESEVLDWLEQHRRGPAPCHQPERVA
jgi:excisionase family DNA binding protein